MKRMKWEYLVSRSEEELGKLGQEGWELVSVVTAEAGASRFYYKRPAPSVSESITLEQRTRVLKGEQEA